jgi:hypothetical protein
VAIASPKPSASAISEISPDEIVTALETVGVTIVTISLGVATLFTVRSTQSASLRAAAEAEEEKREVIADAARDQLLVEVRSKLGRSKFPAEAYSSFPPSKDPDSDLERQSTIALMSAAAPLSLKSQRTELDSAIWQSGLTFLLALGAGTLSFLLILVTLGVSLLGHGAASSTTTSAAAATLTTFLSGGLFWLWRQTKGDEKELRRTLTAEQIVLSIADVRQRDAAKVKLALELVSKKDDVPKLPKKARQAADTKTEFPGPTN